MKDYWKSLRSFVFPAVFGGKTTDLWSAELSCNRSQQDLHHRSPVETLFSTLLPLTHHPQHLHHQTAGQKRVLTHKSDVVINKGNHRNRVIMAMLDQKSVHSAHLLGFTLTRQSFTFSLNFWENNDQPLRKAQQNPNIFPGVSVKVSQHQCALLTAVTICKMDNKQCTCYSHGGHKRQLCLFWGGFKVSVADFMRPSKLFLQALMWTKFNTILHINLWCCTY